MPKAPTSGDTIEGLLHILSTRMERAERHTHNFPRPAPPTPEPEPPTSPPPTGGGCETFSDDFERADGPLGAGWVSGPPMFNGWTHEDLSISGGAAIEVVGSAGPDNTIGNMLSATAYPEQGQFIEVVAANLWQGMASIGNGGLDTETEWHLMLRANTTDESCVYVWFFPYTGEPIPPATIPTTVRTDWGGWVEGDVYVRNAAGVDTFLDWGGHDFPAWADNPQVTLRLESDANGAVRFYFDGELLVDTMIPDGMMPTGDRVGWGPVWYKPGYGSGAGVSVETLEVTGGCLPTPDCSYFGEDWVGASPGPLDPADWTAAVGSTYEGDTHPMHVLVAPGPDAAPAALSDASSWSFATTLEGGDVFAGIQIWQIGSLTIANWVGVLIHFDIDTMSGVEFVYAGGSAGGNLFRRLWVDGISTETFILHLSATPVIMRIEVSGSHYTFKYMVSGTTTYIVCHEFDDDSFNGNRSGMRSRWDDNNDGAGPPHITGFESGCLEVL
jgi:hypothetical protein